MPPESSTLSWREQSILGRIPQVWRASLLGLACASLLLVVLTAKEWGEMIHQWWNIDTYSHILLVPFLIGWLVYIKLDELSGERPEPWLPGLALVIAALGLWFVGRVTDINLIAHAGAVGALQAIVVAMLGVRITTLVFLPIAFAVFLVPFGDEIIPQLQMVTAAISITLTEWSGISAHIDGIYIQTPVGLFIVAEACSGVKFLVAMITLAVLVAFTRFESWTKRALFMLVAIVVPIIANGIRAWGTIYIAQFQGVEFAAGFDHIFYGWIFFALVVAIVLASAWRFFESEPEDYGFRAAELDDLPWLAKLPSGQISSTLMVGTIAALTVLFAGLVAIVPPLAIS